MGYIFGIRGFERPLEFEAQRVDNFFQIKEFKSRIFLIEMIRANSDYKLPQVLSQINSLQIFSNGTALKIFQCVINLFFI